MIPLLSSVIFVCSNVSLYTVCVHCLCLHVIMGHPQQQYTTLSHRRFKATLLSYFTLKITASKSF